MTHENSTAASWLKVYAATALVMLAIDAVWLGFIARPLYVQAIGPLMADPPRWGVAALFYLAYPAGLVWLAVRPQAGTKGLRATAVAGAALGLFAYGTYDLTNLATLRGWPVWIAALDMAWGTAVSAVAAAAGKAVLDRMAR